MAKYLKANAGFLTLGGLVVALGIFMWNVTSTLYKDASEDVRGVGEGVSRLRTDLQATVDGLRNDLRTEAAGLRQETAGLCSDLRTDVGALRTELAGLRKDFGDWRTQIARRLSAANQQQAAHFVLLDHDGKIGKALMKAMPTSGKIMGGQPPTLSLRCQR